MLTFSNMTVVPRDTSATLRWRTSEAGTGQVEYGPSTDYGSLSGEEGSSYRQSIELSGLDPGTLYHFRIRARDEQGGGTLSDDFTFTTLTPGEFESRVRAARADGSLPMTYIVDPSQSVSAAVAQADAGDTIYLTDGTWTGEHVVFERSGIDIAPITLAAYDDASNGMPTLDGVDGTGTGIYSEGASFLVIRGIKLTRYDEAVYILNADDVTIQGNDISQTSARGVWLRGWDDFYRHRVLDNTLTDCALQGDLEGLTGVIYVIGGSGVDLEIKNNRILNSNGGGINAGARDSLFERNYIYNTGRSFSNGTFQQDNIYAMNTLENGRERGFRMDVGGTGNRIIGNRLLNIPGLGLDIYEENSVYFAHNYLENTNGVALGQLDSVFEHNVFVWTGTGIDGAYLSFGGQNYRTIVRNNTIANCRGASGSYGWRMGATDCSVTNNIFVNSLFYFASEGGTNRIAYNDFWDVTTDLTGIALDPTNISADPLFADAAALDFHLKSRAGRWSGTAWVLDDVTSPCIDAGDPASPFDAEADPNGGRVNMGVYGNTPEASKSP